MMARMGDIVTNAYFNALTFRPLLGTLINNIPAMPLHDAHFGGFFVSGGRK
tara:strand:- start:12639 stop:12791 length:153 start_codon:yes stop_codon:yes gene_type:complete